jgi:chitinase
MARRIVALTALTVFCGSSAVFAQGGRDRTPPTAPTNLVVTSMTQTSVSLAWAASTDNSGRFSYVICCAPNTVTVGQTVTSHTLQGLQSGKTYIIRVYAKDAAGNQSKSSNAVTVTLPGTVAAPTKPVVSLVNVGPTHASLTWSSTDNGPIIWYTIHIDGEAVFTLSSRNGTFTCAKVLVPTGCLPLNQATTYTFTVRARDVDGNLSPMSDPVIVTTRDADPNDHVPPTVPAHLTADQDGALLNVGWDASTDDFAPQQFIRYDLYVNGTLRAVVIGQTTAQIEFDYGTTSNIAIVAVDTADNESAPGTISVTH